MCILLGISLSFSMSKNMFIKRPSESFQYELQWSMIILSTHLESPTKNVVQVYVVQVRD